MHSITHKIGAYTPVLQAEQVGAANKGDLAVQDGENFAWNAHGVFSAHSHVIHAAVPPALDVHPADFTVSNRQVFMFSNGAYEVVGGVFTLLYGYALPQAPAAYSLVPYKWSYAYVGTKHIFSHPTVSDVIWYDEFLDQWGNHRDACWTGPIYGITNADNRLVLQLTDVVVWSQFDEGLVFDPDIYTGTGCQSLALIRYGQPFGLQPYRDGWLSFTSHGIMVSKVANSNLPAPTEGQISGTVSFHHDELAFQDLPLGPAAIEHIGMAHVIWLGREGFHQYSPGNGSSVYGTVGLWEDAMSAFYREFVNPSRVGQVAGFEDAVCITWAREVGWLFVSSRSSALAPHYNRAHVWQSNLQAWGSFNHNHLGICLGHGDNHSVANAYGFINGAGQYCVVDHVPRDFISWVKLTPLTFTTPPDFQGQTTGLVSVQHVRLGVSKHVGPQGLLKGALSSTWFQEKQGAEFATRCDVLVSGGPDANTPLVDEQEYAHMVSRADEVINYACHVTGADVTVFVIANEQDYYFDLSHVSLDYFFAGIQ